MSTFTLEYRFIEGDGQDTEWRVEATFDNGHDAGYAYWDHLQNFKNAQARIRKTVQVDEVIALYQPLEPEDM